MKLNHKAILFLFVAMLVPLVLQAQPPAQPGPPGGSILELAARVSTLEASVAVLQANVSGLQTTVSALQTTVASLQAGGGGSWVTVQDIVLGADAATFDVGGLDLDTHKLYKVYALLTSDGSQLQPFQLTLYYNTDFTDANYNSREFGPAGSGGDPTIGAIGDHGGTGMVEISISRGLNGRVIAITNGVELDGFGGFSVPHIFGHSWNNNANVTALRLGNLNPSSPDLFKMGSRLIVMRPAL